MLTNKFQYAPDDAAGGSGSGDGGKKPVRTRALPQADIDLMDVGKKVAATWQVNPQITLVWKKPGDFAGDVTAYAGSLESRMDTGSQRPAQALTLKQLDGQIDFAVGEVKVYIEKKYKRANATAQFPRFGINKINTAYLMNRDRNNRKAALKLMVDSIAADGFADEEYGTSFWTGIKTAYDAALDVASKTTGAVSGKVADKNQLKKTVEKVMSSLMFVLRGNYPDTYKEIYRQWGWKKESY